MRRISTGIVGRELLGRFTAFDNSLRSIENNQDIVLNPNGAGVISAESHLRIDGDHALIFRDSDNNNTITIESPSISSDYTLTLPNNDGVAGTVLSTDGVGNLSFVDIALGVNNQTADTTTYYPTLSLDTTGEITDLTVSSSKLSFQPSTGKLTVTDIACTDIISSGDIKTASLKDSSGNNMLSGVVSTGQVSLSDGLATVSTGISVVDATFMLALGIDDPDADSEVVGGLFWDDSQGEYYIRIREFETSVNPTVNYDVIRVR